MIQYLVVTEQGKITGSEPSLPISDVDLAWVNKPSTERLIDRLTQKMKGIVDCQIIFDKIDWNTDSVTHILTTI